MPLQQFKEEGLLFNTNFLDQTSTSGLYAYRGELVLVEGEIADEKGHTKPPVEVMRGAVLLGDEKLKLLVGAIDDIASINTLIEKYKDLFSPEMKALLYVVNIESPAQVEIEGITFVLIPLVQGVPWNEAIDELALEKSDFKGQSSADKLVTLLDELKTYKPKYPVAPLTDVVAGATDVKREGWGAV
ncbi:MAG: hypothetical protein JAZ06_13455 [Candidatus Thiodiazotropha taylori]|nr:hypothetical protein [Candidatus Thiodiazotropha taylori]